MITTFQLRAARSGIGITLKDLSKITGVGYVTLSKIEEGAVYNTPRIRKATLEKIVTFYSKCGVKFIDDHSIIIDFNRI